MSCMRESGIVFNLVDNIDRWIRNIFSILCKDDNIIKKVPLQINERVHSHTSQYMEAAYQKHQL